MDKIKIVSAEQKQKLIVQMRGMRQREQQSNVHFKCKLSKVTQKHFALMKQNINDINDDWKEKIAKLQEYHEAQVKVLTEKLRQQQNKYNSEIKQLYHALRGQLKRIRTTLLA